MPLPIKEYINPLSILFICLIIASIVVISPVFSMLFLAAIIAYCARPIYKKIGKHCKYDSISVFISLFIFIIPLIILIIISKELNNKKFSILISIFYYLSVSSINLSLCFLLRYFCSLYDKYEVPLPIIAPTNTSLG